MGTLISTVLGVAAAIGVIVLLFTGANLLLNRTSQRVELSIRPWLFVGPAIIVLAVTLVIPAIRTIILSFRAGRRGGDGFSLTNWDAVLSDKGVVNFTNIDNIFTSRLFILAVVLVVLGVAIARRSAARQASEGFDFGSPTASIALVIAVIAVLLAIFSTLRGVLWNNLWWVVAVTGLSTVIGLAIAVLADRSKGENLARSLIFMPMAISFVGAAIIWSYVYNVKAASQSPGLLNAVVDLFGMEQKDWLRDASIIPWNNFFIMIIMIWIQTGFAMVVLSAAIKGVPTELIEAAKVDGANDVQVFWRVTLPQIRSTIVVVVTTLIVTVMKVFDLIKATTNGNFGTDVLANRMYEGLRNGNFTLSSTFAVGVLVLVLPIMWINTRGSSREVRS